MQSEMTTTYRDVSFWRKITSAARTAGTRAIGTALTLYYAAQSPNTPTWARSVVLGTLAYFILPLDAVPDLLPGVGYTDDLFVLASAAAMVAMHITPEMKERATRKLKDWFAV